MVYNGLILTCGKHWVFVLVLEKKNVVWFNSKSRKKSSLREIPKRRLGSGCRSVESKHYRITCVNFSMTLLFSFAINLLI